MDSFPLSIGGEHETDFSWTVPEYPHSQFWDLHAALYDDGVLIASEFFNLDVVSTPLDRDSVQQIQQAMEECERGAACRSSLKSLIPFFGTLTAAESAEDIQCLAHLLGEQGNQLGETVMYFSESLHFATATINGINEILWLSGIGSPVAGAFEIGLLVSDLANSAFLCTARLFGWDAPAPLRAGGGSFGTFISELADTTLVTLERAGIPYSNEILVEGRNTVHARLDTAFSSLDSVGVNVAYVTRLPSHASTYTHIGPEPLPLGRPEAENPHDVIDIEIRPEPSADQLAVVLLHRIHDGSVLDLRYEPITVFSTTIVSASLADTLTVIPLEVDFDGDGDIDEFHYPGGVVVSVGAPPTAPTPIATRLYPNQPNPFNPNTTIRFTLGQKGLALVRIYDVNGRLVAPLFSAVAEPGEHEIVWDGQTVRGGPASSGVYYCRLNTRDVVDVSKLVLIR